MGKLLASARALRASRPGQGSEPDFRARTGGQSLRHWKTVGTSRGFPTLGCACPRSALRKLRPSPILGAAGRCLSETSKLEGPEGYGFLIIRQQPLASSYHC